MPFPSGAPLLRKILDLPLFSNVKLTLTLLSCGGPVSVYITVKWPNAFVRKKVN